MADHNLQTNENNVAGNSTGTSTNLRKRQNDENSIARTKSKRTTSNIDRLGTGEFESNDDDFFDNINREQQKDDAGGVPARDNSITPLIAPSIGSVNERDSENGQATMSPGERILLGKLLDMMAEIKLMQKNVAELSEQVAKQTARESCTGTSLKRLKRNELMELGLPLKNADELNTFESKLKEDEFYRKTVYFSSL